MSIGARIKSGRDMRGISQRQLADAIGVSVQAVSNWENDKNDPGFARVNTIANILGVDMGWLTGDQSLSQGDDFPSRIFNKDVVPLVTVEDSIYFSALIGSRRKIPSETKFISPSVKLVGQGFAIKMPDQALSPEINKDDVLVFDNGISPELGDIVVVLRFMDALHPTIRQLYSIKSSGAGPLSDITVCRALNDDFDDLVIGGDAGPGMFVATMVEYRSFRRHVRRWLDIQP